MLLNWVDSKLGPLTTDHAPVPTDAVLPDNVADEVRAVAHSCVGASATCGMNAIVPPLRELEMNAKNGHLAPAPGALTAAYSALETIRCFLSAKMNQLKAA